MLELMYGGHHCCLELKDCLCVYWLLRMAVVRREGQQRTQRKRTARLPRARRETLCWLQPMSLMKPCAFVLPADGSLVSGRHALLSPSALDPSP